METQVKIITDFIQKTVKDAGFQKVILGLSGGLDSAVVATLCQKALGKENVIAIMMPYKTSSNDSLKHAMLLVEFLGIEYDIKPITSMMDVYLLHEKEANTLRQGNMMARIRMCILYDLSAKLTALVVGSSNFSEIYSGYCTQFGDTGCAFEPIAHLTKTEVYEVADFLKIPEEIINKKPSADLFEGQTDEQDLGISYPLLDEILRLNYQEKKDKKTILKQGIAEENYDLVMNRIQKNAFKRRMPLTINNVWEK